jgi:hypothetical protein
MESHRRALTRLPKGAITLLAALLSLPLAAQRFETASFEGGEGTYSGKFRYSAGSEMITLWGVTGLNFPDRVGGGIGYGQIQRRSRSMYVACLYYHNVIPEQEANDVLSLCYTYYFCLVKLGSFSRVLFGLSPELGYQYAKSLKIENAEKHVFLYGVGAKLEYEHLIGGSFGLFFGVTQNVEFLTKISQVRLRHFIDVGVKIGI